MQVSQGRFKGEEDSTYKTSEEKIGLPSKGRNQTSQSSFVSSLFLFLPCRTHKGQSDPPAEERRSLNVSDFENGILNDST